MAIHWLGLCCFPMPLSLLTPLLLCLEWNLPGSLMWLDTHLTCDIHKALMIVFLCSLVIAPQGLIWPLTITCGPSIGLSLISQLRAYMMNWQVIVCPVLVCVLDVSCAGLCPRCVLCLSVSGCVLYWLVSGVSCVVHVLCGLAHQLSSSLLLLFLYIPVYLDPPVSCLPSCFRFFHIHGDNLPWFYKWPCG